MVKIATRGPQPADHYVGSRIRLRRGLSRFSQATLAELIGVTAQQMQKYERGANRIGVSRLLQICDALDVTPAWLLDGAPGNVKAHMPSVAERDLTAFHADRLAPELIKNFVRVPYRIRRVMVNLMAAVAEGS